MTTGIQLIMILLGVFALLLTLALVFGVFLWMLLFAGITLHSIYGLYTTAVGSDEVSLRTRFGGIAGDYGLLFWGTGFGIVIFETFTLGLLAMAKATNAMAARLGTTPPYENLTAGMPSMWRALFEVIAMPAVPFAIGLLLVVASSRYAPGSESERWLAELEET